LRVRTRIRLTAGLLLLLLTGRLAYASDTEPEDALKAVVVLNFLRYSTWPDATGPITVGMVGRSSALAPFRQVLEGKSVNGRIIHLVEIKGVPEPRCCQVLYVASDQAARIRQSLAGARSAHILTIGENDKFLECGGAVNLFLVDGHISFEVNLEVLEGSGIEISSRLLHLGQIKGKPSW
jgi:hypothetical protein